MSPHSSSASLENPTSSSYSTSSSSTCSRRRAPRSEWRPLCPLPPPYAPGRLKDPKVLLPTIVAGLQTYFDRALGANLLYRFERPQYAEVRKRYVTGPTVQVGQEKEMSAIYGAEHFLRMLGALRLPACLIIRRAC